jgi:hypothetical protein
MRAVPSSPSCGFAILLSSVLLSPIPFLTSCKTGSGGSQETGYSAIVRKQEDRLERVPNPAGFTFLVNCTSGIGGATVSWHGGRWPEEVLVRLRYAEGNPFTRIEGFTVAVDRGKPIEVRSIAFLPEWAEVRVPAELLNSATDTLHFEWVDMYRR